MSYPVLSAKYLKRGEYFRDITSSEYIGWTQILTTFFPGLGGAGEIHPAIDKTRPVKIHKQEIILDISTYNAPKILNMLSVAAFSTG